MIQLSQKVFRDVEWLDNAVQEKVHCEQRRKPNMVGEQDWNRSKPCLTLTVRQGLVSDGHRFGVLRHPLVDVTNYTLLSRSASEVDSLRLGIFARHNRSLVDFDGREFGVGLRRSREMAAWIVVPIGRAKTLRRQEKNLGCGLTTSPCMEINLVSIESFFASCPIQLPQRPQGWCVPKGPMFAPNSSVCVPHVRQPSLLADVESPWFACSPLFHSSFCR